MYHLSMIRESFSVSVLNVPVNPIGVLYCVRVQNVAATSVTTWQYCLFQAASQQFPAAKLTLPLQVRLLFTLGSSVSSSF